MNTLGIHSILLAAFGAASLALAQPAPSWHRTYDSIAHQDDAGIAAAHGPSGTVAITGWSIGPATQKDFATVKYDRDGNVLWTARYNGPVTGGGNDLPVAVGMDAAGNVYVTGSSWGGLSPAASDWDYATIKYNTSGQAVWTKRFNGLQNSEDLPTGMVVDAAGNVYICGFSSAAPDPIGRFATHFHVLKYDTNGTLVWEHLIDNPVHLGSGARAIAIGRDGNIYATGVIIGGDIYNPDDNIMVAKFTPAGDIVYWTQYSSPGFNSGLDDGQYITADAQGNAYVAGQTYDVDNTWDTTTLKLGPTGSVLWVSVLSLPDPDGPFGIDIDQSGNVYVGGVTNGFDDDGFVVAYSPSGVQRWFHLIDGPEIGYEQAVIGIRVGTDGNIYAAADIEYLTGFDNTLIRYSPAGVLLDWTPADGGSPNEIVNGFDLAPDNTVYMAGEGYFTTNDMLAIKFSGSGAPPCDANCDNSTAPPILNANDFQCFLNTFAAGDPAANCDGSTAPPVLNANDFQCFLNRYAAGCP